MQEDYFEQYMRKYYHDWKLDYTRYYPFYIKMSVTEQFRLMGLEGLDIEGRKVDIIFENIIRKTEIKEYKKRNDELDKKIESLSNQINQNNIIRPIANVKVSKERNQNIINSLSVKDDE